MQTILMYRHGVVETTKSSSSAGLLLPPSLALEADMVSSAQLARPSEAKVIILLCVLFVCASHQIS